MPTLTPFLWMNCNLDELAAHYASIFSEVEVLERQGAPDEAPFMMRIRLLGNDFLLMNAGPRYELDPAFSMFVLVETQEEVDRYWAALTDGGEPSRCGWLVDRFGVSWQIVPTALGELLGSPDRDAAGRTHAAMMTMNKLDIAALQAAHAG